MQESIPEYAVADLAECRRCHRKFNKDRIYKHESVCQGERIDVRKPNPKELEVQYKRQTKE